MVKLLIIQYSCVPKYRVVNRHTKLGSIKKRASSFPIFCHPAKNKKGVAKSLPVIT